MKKVNQKEFLERSGTYYATTHSKQVAALLNSLFGDDLSANVKRAQACTIFFMLGVTFIIYRYIWT